MGTIRMRTAAKEEFAFKFKGTVYRGIEKAIKANTLKGGKYTAFVVDMGSDAYAFLFGYDPRVDVSMDAGSRAFMYHNNVSNVRPGHEGFPFEGNDLK